MIFDEIHHSESIQLLRCISGSKAYGLDTPESDTDIKGVFILPKMAYYGLQYISQVNNSSNDIVYYELQRFFDLLLKNNPNILELLGTEQQDILYRHPVMKKITPDLFLSKLCKDTFAGYATSQVKKARGLNKKIVNPIARERKEITDFCYVITLAGSLPLSQWLNDNSITQEQCGLTKVPHSRDLYFLYIDIQHLANFNGITSGKNANDVSLSSVTKNMIPVACLSFNKDGYSTYCKNYREYWEWVNIRNETRHKKNLENEKNYDAKNMMHTFRLLTMAEEIASEGKIFVRRKDREFLLHIRNGAFEYDTLVKMADEKTQHIDQLYASSSLPDRPDMEKSGQLLAEIRDYIYSHGSGLL